jgi:ABC-type siderophore export system fused ATPase/permease subunit
MMMKSAKKSIPAVTPEVMPMMYKAAHAGIEVLRYLNDPISMKREADPINEIPRAIKTLLIMLIMSSLLRRFLKAASASFIYSLRRAFISLRIAPIISLNEIFSDIDNFASSKYPLDLKFFDFLKTIWDDY